MNIDKQRAMAALEKVSVYIANKDAEHQKKLKSTLKSLPAMIRTNGLGQALAWHKGKGDVHAEVYRWVSDWVVKQRGLFGGDSGEFLKVVVTSDLAAYQMAQAEALVYSGWLKKMGSALIEV